MFLGDVIRFSIAARAEERGLEPLKEVLENFGGWPVVIGDAWDDTDFVWYEMIYKFRQVGYSIDYFVDFSVTADLKNSTTRIIDVIQETLSTFFHIFYQRFLLNSSTKRRSACPVASTSSKASTTRT